jgi:glycosyltransferase involved in cell wall biosynthesis
MLSRTVGDSVEGFGISAIEASGRGKPVVVSDQGGMPETVLPGCTGVVVPVGDTGRLAGALAELARDSNLRRRMGEDGRRFVLSTFIPQITAGRLHAQLTDRSPGTHAPTVTAMSRSG